MKVFKRTIEDFVCDKCHMSIKGTGYTNHCHNCLFSKHVDINPGDRANTCRGLMEPINFDQKNGILHRCQICKFEKNNKIQPADNLDQIILLTVMV